MPHKERRVDRLMIPKWSTRGVLWLALGLGVVLGTGDRLLAQEQDAPVTRPQAETEETDRVVLPLFRCSASSGIN